VVVEDGKIVIRSEGKAVKFVKEVGQITFSGKVAREEGHKVLYITERCVFQLTPEGVVLTEIAPGVDLEQDILARMEFRPLISPELKEMDPRLFADAPMSSSA
jgi:propionate CoA-transferase